MDTLATEQNSARRTWSALRRELEAVAAQPERVAAAALPARLASWPEQLDEPEPASEPTPGLALWPIAALNKLYDAATYPLGPLGRWLRSARGRAALGYVGLTLIGVAIAWSLRDWLGWWW